MIQRMLSNLLDNAIKYTPSGGSVTVSLEEQSGTPGISVKDTGIGISAERLPRIFERFYRCDQSRSQAGIGLGLSLARAIARAHGGRHHSRKSPESGKHLHRHPPQIPTASILITPKPNMTNL